MIDSRDIKELHPTVQVMCHAMLDACASKGITLLITSTFRDNECQDALYAKGRSGIFTKEKKVTNAKGGQSLHNYRLAFDVVPLVYGKPIWNNKDPIWKEIGELGKSVGLEWAGDWKTFKEFPHFQYTGGLTLADLQSGKRLV